MIVNRTKIVSCYENELYDNLRYNNAFIQIKMNSPKQPFGGWVGEIQLSHLSKVAHHITIKSRSFVNTNMVLTNSNNDNLRLKTNCIS